MELEWCSNFLQTSFGGRMVDTVQNEETHWLDIIKWITFVKLTLTSIYFIFFYLNWILWFWTILKNFNMVLKIKVLFWLACSLLVYSMTYLRINALIKGYWRAVTTSVNRSTPIFLASQSIIKVLSASKHNNYLVHDWFISMVSLVSRSISNPIKCPKWALMSFWSKTSKAFWSE